MRRVRRSVVLTEKLAGQTCPAGSQAIHASCTWPRSPQPDGCHGAEQVFLPQRRKRQTQDLMAIAPTTRYAITRSID
jgi:hypothetical protein